MRIAAIAGVLALGIGAAGARADDFRDEVAVRAGGTLTVDLAAGALRIETHDAERVEVDALGSGWGDGRRFTLASDGENAHLVGERRLFPFPFPLMSFGTLVRVRVPEEYSLDLHTAGGPIEIEAVRGGVRAKTSGGPIDLQGAVGLVELGTSGGRIRIEDVRGDTVARTSRGSITADDIVGALEVKTSGGPSACRTSGAVRSARTRAAGASRRASRAARGGSSRPPAAASKWSSPRARART